MVDAKLARTAKARAVLQAAFYSHLLAVPQGVEPRWMHLALGHGEFGSFRVADYGAYERQTRRLLSAAVSAGEPADPYPEPVEHCAVCRWSQAFGLQYLFGVVDTAEEDPAGRPRYTQIWCFDRAGEKRAFEELIDFVTSRRARHPGLHVYHYNHYEPTSVDHLTELHGTREEAVGALMGRFAAREDEVDDLLRLGVFVDLYRVVRQGLRAGVELLDQAAGAAVRV